MLLRSQFSHQIARMEARGTVERAPCAGDRRGFDAVLTETGRAAIEVAAPKHLFAVRHYFADLLTAEQLDALGDIAEAITSHLAAEHPEVPDKGAEPLKASIGDGVDSSTVGRPFSDAEHLLVVD